MKNYVVTCELPNSADYDTADAAVRCVDSKSERCLHSVWLINSAQSAGEIKDEIWPKLMKGKLIVIEAPDIAGAAMGPSGAFIKKFLKMVPQPYQTPTTPGRQG